MKISIITVCFNSESTIHDTIQSVIDQSYDDIEYIIIDGASGDNTLNIINEFKGNISYLISEPDEGLYYAMNKGIGLATGEIIGILNSDDLYFNKDTLQKVVSLFKSDDDVEVVYGDLIYVSSDDTNRVVRYWKSKPYYNSFFEDANVPPHPAFFVKKSLYDRIGLYNTVLKLASDYEFMLRAMKANIVKSIYIPMVLVRMRLGGETNKSIINIIKGNGEISIAWRVNGFSLPVLYWPKKTLNKISQYWIMDLKVLSLLRKIKVLK